MDSQVVFWLVIAGSALCFGAYRAWKWAEEWITGIEDQINILSKLVSNHGTTLDAVGGLCKSLAEEATGLQERITIQGVAIQEQIKELAVKDQVVALSDRIYKLNNEFRTRICDLERDFKALVDHNEAIRTDLMLHRHAQSEEISALVGGFEYSYKMLNERLIALETTNKPPAEPKKEENYDPASSWQVQRNRAELGALNGR